MKNNIYVFYNRLSKRYGDVFCAPTDEFASNLVTKAASTPNSGLNLAETEVCRIASVDIELGVVTAETAPVRIDVTYPAVPIDSLCTESNPN